MSTTTTTKSPRDVKTLGYVLRRTDFGEADRILNIITPQGKIAAVARGARKEKSKLAGGIELFTLSQFQIHQGRSELGIVTSAKMQEFHSGIIRDLDRMELAAKILKQVNAAAEHTNSEEYFWLVKQGFSALGKGDDLALVEAWFGINLKRVLGEEVNLYRDESGEKLAAEQRYAWDAFEKAFRKAPNGEFGANEIKLMRLMASNDLRIVKKVKFASELLQPISLVLSSGESHRR